MAYVPPTPAEVQAQVDALFTTRSLPRVPLADVLRGASAGLAATALAFLITYFSLGPVAPTRLGISVGATLLVVCALIALAQLAPLARFPAWILLASALPPAALGIGLRQLDQPFAASLMLATAAALIGFGASRSVLRLSWVIPLAAAAALSDAHSVYFGPTGEFLEKSASGGQASINISEPDGLFEYLVMHLPAIGGVWRLGSIDVLFAALFLGLSQHFRLPVWRTAAGLACGFVAALAIPNGAPVIPFFAIGFVVAHSRKLIRDLRHAMGNFALSVRG